MFRKITVIVLLFVFLFASVHADIEITEFPENETNNQAPEVVVAEGRIVAKIKTEREVAVNEMKAEFKNEFSSFKTEMKDYIDSKTNPLWINFPTLALLIIIVLVYLILKAGGKI